MASERSTSTRSEQSTDGAKVPAAADWFSAIALLLGGALSLIGGVVLFTILDRGEVIEEAAGGEITLLTRTTELADAAAASLATDVITWVGIGFLFTGSVTVLFAIWFAVARYRSRRSSGGRSRRSTLPSAVFGGVIGAIAGFIPIFPAVGGTVAGYVEGRSGRPVRVGALAGVLASIPIIVVLAAALTGLTSGLLALDRSELATLAGLSLLAVVTVGTAIAAGLGAVGGFVGGKVGSR